MAKIKKNIRREEVRIKQVIGNKINGMTVDKEKTSKYKVSV